MGKGPRRLRVDFGTETLTHYGGVYLVHRFLTRIGLKHAVAREIRVLQRNNRYSVGETFLAVLYPMILGLEDVAVGRVQQAPVRPGRSRGRTAAAAAKAVTPTASQTTTSPQRV
jgi:hypothetical protein